MPLALQALLPFIALLGAAAVVQRRPRRRVNGWIALWYDCAGAGL